LPTVGDGSCASKRKRKNRPPASVPLLHYSGGYHGCFAAATNIIGITNDVNSRNLKPMEDANMEETSYALVGEYYLPLITLSDQPDAPPLGLYGELHKKHLRNNKPILYSHLLLSEKLYPLCRAVDDAAANRLMTIPDREQAHEIIVSELVYI